MNLKQRRLYHPKQQFSSLWNPPNLSRDNVVPKAGTVNLAWLSEQRRTTHSDQFLTFGVAVVLSETVEIIWGPRIRSIPPPSFLSGSVEFLGINYPSYRLVILLVAGVVAGSVWFVMRRTNIGLIIRSGTHDREMVEALGINIRIVFTGVFVAGTMLAALAGVLIGPLRNVHPEMGAGVIVYAFIAVIIGGLGNACESVRSIRNFEAIQS